MRCAVAMLLTVLLVLGCEEEERAPWAPRLQSGNITGGKPMREVLERGLADDEVLRCDIRRSDCQRRIFDATMAVRGGDAPRPPVGVVSRDVLAMQLREDADSATPRAALGALAALGLVDPDLLATDVAGETADALLAAYFFETDRVIVIDHGRPLDTVEAALTLAHEFVHALQDGERDLIELTRAATTTDEREGLLGLIEGEAELYAALAITGEIETDEAFWRRLRRAVVEGVVGSEAPFFAADLNFPYTFGAEFVAAAYAAEGPEGIARRYDAIPGSAREVLVGPAAAPPPAGWREPVERTEAAAVEAGYEPVWGDAFGAWVLHVFLELPAGGKGRGPRLPGESVASALRGDQVVAWERDGALIVSWRLRFDPEVDPVAVADEIAAGRPDLIVREEAGDVLVFASEQNGALAAFATAFELPPR